MIENLRLDQETGFLYWTGGARKGRRAGSVDKYGYRQIGLGGKVLREHRVVWRLAYGAWPVGTIDHINGIKHDNRPSNLREVSQREQMLNRFEQSTNTSGFTGVTRHKKTGKWQAGIQVDGRHHHLGLFDDPEAAAAARKDAENRLGFHKNHGRARP
ncbi:HNH endonuclease [Pseudomonas sp. Nvir]|uniref:HNH endonuclease n=1 Tax=Pseudomonas sp. Nvir TaxID=2899657 RepID=UPI001E3A70D5|nr:HNH endonuclease [Pseudomonas sp. Nvir]